MTSPHSSDDLLARARDHAAAGAWGDVRLLLSGRPEATGAEPELATLLAEACMRGGRAREARGLLGDAVPALERRHDRSALRRAVNLSGAAHFALGELDDAERAFSRALELGREDGDDLLVARATNNLGAIESIRGRPDSALTLYQLAVPAYQRLGNSLGLAESYHNMAITVRERGLLDRADEYERRAIEYARATGNPRLAAMARVGRAEVWLRSGDPAVACATACRAAREFAAIPEPALEADALRVAGVASVVLGALDEAATLITRALETARAGGHALVEGETLHAQAELHAARGDLTAARADAGAAIAIFERLGATPERDAVREWLEGIAPAASDE